MVLSCICAWFAHLKIQPTKLVFVLSDIFLAYGFSFLVASMGLQMIWSLGLACLDVYATSARSRTTYGKKFLIFCIFKIKLSIIFLKVYQKEMSIYLNKP